MHNKIIIFHFKHIPHFSYIGPSHFTLTLLLQCYLTHFTLLALTLGPHISLFIDCFQREMSKWYRSAEVASGTGAGMCASMCACTPWFRGKRGPASDHSGLLFPSSLPSLPPLPVALHSSHYRHRGGGGWTGWDEEA